MTEGTQGRQNNVCQVFEQISGLEAGRRRVVRHAVLLISPKVGAATCQCTNPEFVDFPRTSFIDVVLYTVA